MLQFAYQDEALGGRPPPSLPASATVRWRPLVPVTLLGPTGRRRRTAKTTSSAIAPVPTRSRTTTVAGIASTPSLIRM